MLCSTVSANRRAHIVAFTAFMVTVGTARADSSFGRSSTSSVSGESSLQSDQHFRGNLEKEKAQPSFHRSKHALDPIFNAIHRIQGGNFEMPVVTSTVRRLFLDRDAWFVKPFELAFAAMTRSQKGKLELPAVSDVMRRLFSGFQT